MNYCPLISSEICIRMNEFRWMDLELDLKTLGCVHLLLFYFFSEMCFFSFQVLPSMVEDAQRLFEIIRGGSLEMRPDATPFFLIEFTPSKCFDLDAILRLI